MVFWLGPGTTCQHVATGLVGLAALPRLVELVELVELVGSDEEGDAEVAQPVSATSTTNTIRATSMARPAMRTTKSVILRTPVLAFV
jgi:hypothetical protein